ncbi:hypothetical protein [Streptomyces sp. NBC_00572]|uniref:hypothetical protein n=1 Tax=Streptomyces sp. NBC_00572 TaxID=2903664 RepID=UPI0022522ABF|nr:hypothetical protein [Streptomyces sp. NBC_00572]MCX4985925.1 hypothetical protein [Streptomyces sp. NBC_00572]
MPVVLRRPAATLVCVAVTLSATACSPHLGDLPQAEILGRAIRATESAKSVTVHTDALSWGTPMKGHLSHDSRGNCTATMSYGPAGTAEMIMIDNKDVYLRRDEALLRMQERHRSPKDLEALIEDLRGRWTKPPLDGPDAPDELALCGGKRTPGEERTPTGLENGWDDASAKAEATTIDGQKALKLAKPVGSDGETTTVYIAAEGPPYLLKIVNTRGEMPGTTTYSRYNRPVEAKAPQAKDVVVTD